MAPGDARIGTLHLAPLDRARQAAVRHIGLRHQQQSRRVAVQPMDDPRPALRRSFGKRGASPHQDVDQGVVPVPRPRVHHQASRFVEHREVRVFEYETQLCVVWGVGAG